jgi:hypothetical protein
MTALNKPVVLSLRNHIGARGTSERHFGKTRTTVVGQLRIKCHRAGAAAWTRCPSVERFS